MARWAHRVITIRMIIQAAAIVDPGPTGQIDE
jgi:hypothetical protein